MKAFTFYSESHKHLLDLLVKSFLSHSNLDLTIRKIPQESSGDYHSQGWEESMVRKVQYIVDSLSMCDPDEIMIHLDSDIIINKDFDSYIEDNMTKNSCDIIFQWDSSGICMGFFACKNCDRIKNFFQHLLDQLPNHRDDQYCANHLLKHEYKDLNVGIFDENVYTIGMNHPMYSRGMSIKIPSNWKAFHANFTQSLQDKTDLLQAVSSLV